MAAGETRRYHFLCIETTTKNDFARKKLPCWKAKNLKQLFNIWTIFNSFGSFMKIILIIFICNGVPHNGREWCL